MLMKILIVGAGFGGLALAAYPQRDGHAVTIVEKQQDHPQAGFIIGLWHRTNDIVPPL
jgi:2-polyprenyl-6-methoxyphenol hydroxylase-like FAD-dependent oxidoreductase